MSKARRAKKSRVPIKLIIFSMLTIFTCGMFMMYINTPKESLGSLNAELGTYEANDFMKAAFTTKDNTKYLPIVLDNTDEHLTRKDIENEFKKFGLTVKNISSNIIASGTKVETTNGFTYTLLIYGDANQDGSVNVLDVLTLINSILGGDKSALTGMSRLSGNVDTISEDSISVLDVLRIIDFIVGNKSIVDIKTLPASDIATDKIKPNITLKGGDKVIKLGEPYVDEGAKVTDNLDTVIHNKVIMADNKVDVNKPDTYILKYNITDASGNKADTVTRKVTVEDYIDDIKIVTNPAVKYYEGQPISIKGIIAHPIMKYMNREDTANVLDESKLKLSEDTEKVAKKDMTKITVVYEGKYKTVNKDIAIEVEENKPIINLIGGDEVIKLDKTGTKYVDKGAKAIDIDGKELECKVSVTNSKGEEINLEGIDLSVEETYTIHYNAKNELEQPADEVTRTVRVVDYIVSVSVDASNIKTSYTEGQDIDLSGAIITATFASGKTENLDNPTLRADIEKATYVDGNEKISEIFCMITDPVDGQKEMNTNLNAPIAISIMKKLESIRTVADIRDITDITKNGYKYEEILVTRVRSGEAEEPVTVNNIDFVITPEPENGSITRAIPYPVTKNGKVVENEIDVKFIADKDQTYTLTIIPKGSNSDTEDADSETTNKGLKISDIKIDKDPFVNLATLSQFKIGDFETDTDSGEKVFVGNTINSGDKVKADEGRIIAKVDFKHLYKYGSGYTDDIDSVDASSNIINVIIEKKVEHEGAQPTWENITQNDGIRFKKLDSAGIEGSGNTEIEYIEIVPTETNTSYGMGTEFRVMVEVNNETGKQEGTFGTNYRDIKICNKSDFDLTFGYGTGENDYDTIVLSTRTINRNENFIEKFKDIRGEHYTLLPITLKDQYGEYKDILFNDVVINNKSEIANGKIVIYENSAAGQTCIKKVGVDTDENEVDGIINNNPLRYVGLALNGNGAELLKKITVYYEDVEYDFNVRIEKSVITSLKYDEDTKGIETEGDCFGLLPIARVKSGEGQNNLLEGDITVDIQKAKEDADGNTIMPYVWETSTVRIDTNSIKPNNVYFETSIDDNGIVTVYFKAANSGIYKVLPKYDGSKGTKGITPVTADGTENPVIITITEDITVNEIAFIGTNIDNTNQELAKGRFGNAALTVKEAKEIVFKHVYKATVTENGEEKEIILDTRVVDHVNRNLVTIENLNRDKMDVEARAGSISVNGSNPEDSGTWIDSVLVQVTDEDSVEKDLSFKVKVAKYVGDTKPSEFPITLTVKPKPVIEDVDVGHGTGSTAHPEELKIYLSAPTDEDKFFNENVIQTSYSDEDTGNTYTGYFTLVPISLVTSTGNKVNSSDLNANNLTTSLEVKTTQDKISFIDDHNTGLMMLDKSSIVVKGFKKIQGTNGEIIVEASGSDVIDYVGITISEAMKHALNPGLPKDDEILNAIIEDAKENDPDLYEKYMNAWKDGLTKVEVFFCKTEGDTVGDNPSHVFKIVTSGEFASN